MLSLYLTACQRNKPHTIQTRLRNAPFIINGLDVEPKGGADLANVLAQNLLHNGSFARVVEATVTRIDTSLTEQIHLDMCSHFPYSIRMRSSLSLSLAFRRIDNMFYLGCLSPVGCCGVAIEGH